MSPLAKGGRRGCVDTQEQEPLLPCEVRQVPRCDIRRRAMIADHKRVQRSLLPTEQRFSCPVTMGLVPRCPRTSLRTEESRDCARGRPARQPPRATSLSKRTGRDPRFPEGEGTGAWAARYNDRPGSRGIFDCIVVQDFLLPKPLCNNIRIASGYAIHSSRNTRIASDSTVSSSSTSISR